MRPFPSTTSSGQDRGRWRDSLALEATKATDLEDFDLDVEDVTALTVALDGQGVYFAKIESKLPNNKNVRRRVSQRVNFLLRAYMDLVVTCAKVRRARTAEGNTRALVDNTLHRYRSCGRLPFECVLGHSRVRRAFKAPSDSIECYNSGAVRPNGVAQRFINTLLCRN